MQILDKLSLKDEWLAFYEQKQSLGYMTKQQSKEILDFIEEERYLPIAQSIQQNGFCFARPQIKLISKSGTDKKRKVYCFSEDETLVLKLLASLLHKYDDYFCPLCFAFRKNLSVRRALARLIGQVRGRAVYCYKLDIRDYFNSIDIEILLQRLRTVFSDDLRLYQFFEGLLRWEDNSLHGAMAGTPTSPFLANVYLSELDRHFFDLNVPYARYSDDIIVFADSLEEIERHKAHINDYLAHMNLAVNTKKEKSIAPNSAWQFLGIEYNNGEIDLAPATLVKIKGKIRRKARSIYRWKKRKDAPNAVAQRVLIRTFNRKFFEDTKNDLTWSRWYFPLLNTTRGLRVVDNYLQMWLRFLASGRHNKANYQKTPYQALKQLGYTSLVNRFHKKTH